MYDIEYLKSELKKLFEKEGIGMCFQRYLDNMVNQHPDDLENVLIIRLRQGGVKI